MKNVILLITDTYRYDNLKKRAVMPVRAPHLDRFAEERATSIENCFINSFPTIPHRTDVATGTAGWPHYGWQQIQLSGPNHIAQMFSKAGYATQLICDCPHLFKNGFQNAFDGAYQLRGQEGDKALLCLNKPIQTVVPLEKTRWKPVYKGHPLVDSHRWINRYWENETQTFPPRTAETAVQWLEENYKAGPFFLWVDWFDPHEPWDPPEYMARKYDPDYKGIPMLHPNYGPATDYNKAELRNLRAHYCAEAELVDRWVGRVLGKIDDLGLWDDSIVMVTTDHGMSLGEHNRTGKSNIHPKDSRFWPVYPEISHVILLMAGGGIPKGKSLDIMVQPVDFIPTLAELAGAPVEPPKKFDGKSFAGCLVGRKKKHRDYMTCGSHIKPADGVVPAKCVTPVVYADKWCYAPVGAKGAPELYNIQKDPLGETNVIDGHTSVVKGLHDLFLADMAKHKAPEDIMAIWRRGPGAGKGKGSWAVDYPGSH
ncbi:MAG: sulfatase [Candidatus Sumerlaeota bacterium]|nr:sulfatase [Candidatus Sumerlaeota bacterium]